MIRVLYIITIILSWFAMRYLIKKSNTRATLLALFMIFIPVFNLIPIAMCISDILTNSSESVEDGIKKLFYIKKPEPFEPKDKS